MANIVFRPLVSFVLPERRAGRPYVRVFAMFEK